MDKNKFNNYASNKNNKNTDNFDTNESFKKKLGTNESNMDFDGSLSVIKKDDLNDSKQSGNIFTTVEDKHGRKERPQQLDNFETYDSTNREDYQSPMSTRMKKRKLVKKLNQSVISSERSEFESSFRKKEMLNDTNGNLDGLKKCLDESSITVEEKDNNYVTTGNDNSFTNYGYLASEEKLRKLVKKSRRTGNLDKIKKHEISINDVQNTNNAILNVNVY
jgi:hypothetical protein